MKAADILASKGHEVVTVRPDTSVQELIAVLARHNIGSAVVTDGTSIAGIVSERDIVRGLYRQGQSLLATTTGAIMSRDIHTCGPEDSIDQLRQIMTEHRIRHLPVLADGQLTGLVSIGDVVKSAIDELETERAHLIDYITH